MIALALERSESGAKKKAEYLKDRQKHRVKKELEEYSLKTSLGYIYLIAEKDSISIDGRRLTWIDHNTPEVEDLPEKILKADSVKDLITILRRVYGFYSGVKITDNSIIIFRDHIGLIPLNMKIMNGKLSMASERIPLGIDAKPIKPGTISIFGESGLKTLEWYEPIRISVSDPVNYLAEQLKDSVKKYVPERCSIAFSGGLDSSIIVYTALRSGKEIEAIVVGVEGCVDLEQALEAAEILGINLKKILVNEKEILKTIQSIIEILPQRSLMDLSLASIFHLVSRNSATKNIVAGQGADELFGGYWKYVEMFKRIREKVNEFIVRDLENLYITNLERDELAAASAKSTLITPYLTRRIYELSKSIDLKMKLREVGGEIVRKWILRKAAEVLGVPEKLRLRPKKAAQYGSGIFKIVKRLSEEGLLTKRSSHR